MELTTGLIAQNTQIDTWQRSNIDSTVDLIFAQCSLDYCSRVSKQANVPRPGSEWLKIIANQVASCVDSHMTGYPLMLEEKLHREGG